MSARAFIMVSALTFLAVPAHADVGGSGVVEIRDSVRKVIAGCTYSVSLTGLYQRGPGAGAVRDAVVDVSTRLACRHQPAVESQRQLYFAATTATDLASRLRDAASIEYVPRPGTRCRVEPTLRAEPAGPVFADLAMTCFAAQLPGR